ncbi:MULTISPECIES: hypothetical protein [unclassified Streptomyces]|uniref:hypothetical protein n=1 Tax=unclassified Streptomyces TaxID=2593676 RepID=UPI002DD885A4|nr:hypothetical protein [Streptomyces sp. NBC_01788]WSB24573.1 hypothetical protein OIE49_00775 [Streptomyces sp. NBC_01788]
MTVDNDIGLLERTLACLVNIEAKNLLNGNQVVLLQNVAVPVVAALCGVNVNVFSAQLNQGKANCPAQSNSNQLAWAVYN